MRRLVIFVSGPYRDTTKRTAKGNVEEADRVGRQLLFERGHFPIVPHTMYRDWESDGPARQQVLDMCKALVIRCDAIVVMNDSEESAGSKEEQKVAEDLGLDVYVLGAGNDLSVVPKASDVTLPAPYSEPRLKGYIEEYKQCGDSYRHIYQTIWAAGTVMVALAGALFALSAKFVETTGAWEYNHLTLGACGVPFLAWYFCVFRRMDYYGDLRAERMGEIEGEMLLLTGARLQTFSRYNAKRDSLRRDVRNAKGLNKAFKWLRLQFVQAGVKERLWLLALLVLGASVAAFARGLAPGQPIWWAMLPGCALALWGLCTVLQRLLLGQTEDTE